VTSYIDTASTLVESTPASSNKRHRDCAGFAGEFVASPLVGATPSENLTNLAGPLTKATENLVFDVPCEVHSCATIILIMRVLVVEDEPKTAAFLKKGLTESGFVVDIATDGVEGAHLALTVNYDVIILDVMLPRKNGWSVVQELRRAGTKTPVVFLTARDTVAERVQGLELGADDYLVKPFAFSELLARMRSLLRRSSAERVDTLRIADLELDLVRHRVTRRNTRLDLTPKEFALLSLFVRRAGEVMSRTLIAEQVWDINFDSDTNVVDVAVRRLRRKVDDPFAQKLIHTVRGVGYVLEAR
jgi:two-component system copper resistance phosphate regulon response regulator CusR